MFTLPKMERISEKFNKKFRVSLIATPFFFRHSRMCQEELYSLLAITALAAAHRSYVMRFSLGREFAGRERHRVEDTAGILILG